MRLRYKKFILFFTLAIMLIGMATFSVIAPNVNFKIGASSNGSLSSTGKVLSSMSDEDIEAEIVTLVKNYFDAKQQVDMEALKECVSDVSHVQVQRLVTDAEYIEAYKNIECTILNEGLPEGSFRVYVYYEAKVYDIDTLVPGLTALYITVDENGKFWIYLSAIDSKVQKAIDKLDNMPKIKKKIDSVQKRLQDIVSKNADVRDFYQMLESTSEDDGTENNENIDKEATFGTPTAEQPQTPATQAPAAAPATQAPAVAPATQAPAAN